MISHDSDKGTKKFRGLVPLPAFELEGRLALAHPTTPPLISHSADSAQHLRRLIQALKLLSYTFRFTILLTSASAALPQSHLYRRAIRHLQHTPRKLLNSQHALGFGSRFRRRSRTRPRGQIQQAYSRW